MAGSRLRVAAGEDRGIPPPEEHDVAQGDVGQIVPPARPAISIAKAWE